MKITSSFVNTLLVREDIEGLIAAGAPADEYEDEATRIGAAVMALSLQQVTQDVVSAIISIIWMKNFDLSEEDIKLRLPGIRSVAQDIVSAIQ